MKSAEKIYEEAKHKVLIEGCQSLNVMAIVAILEGQKEMFNYLYEQALLDENKDLSITDFFDKMDMLNF